VRVASGILLCISVPGPPHYPPPNFRKEVALSIPFVVVAALVATLLLVVLALVREVRLRRALQQLLARLLTHWRKTHVEPLDSSVDRHHAGRDVRDRL
jgi:hypothetical protein